MRLWHKDLIPVLPRQQLLGQWRECCAIAKNIAEKGKPGHILVNKIMEYPIYEFIRYSHSVFSEMQLRKYKCDFSKFMKYFTTKDFLRAQIVPWAGLFLGWHNDRYLKQCYYNLQEKYDCGGISVEEWQKIERAVLARIE